MKDNIFMLEFHQPARCDFVHPQGQPLDLDLGKSERLRFTKDSIPFVCMMSDLDKCYLFSLTF
jgi:hypothetical protein